MRIKNIKHNEMVDMSELVLLNHLTDVLDELNAEDILGDSQREDLVLEASQLTEELMGFAMARDRSWNDRPKLLDDKLGLEVKLNGQVLELKIA